MRRKIEDLVELGPLPGEREAAVPFLERFELLLSAIRSELSEKPLTKEEVRALIGLFGPDNAYGLAWTLIHTIESAPDWPIDDCLKDTSNEWIGYLKQRIENARRQEA